VPLVKVEDTVASPNPMQRPKTIPLLHRHPGTSKPMNVSLQIVEEGNDVVVMVVAVVVDEMVVVVVVGTKEDPRNAAAAMVPHWIIVVGDAWTMDKIHGNSTTGIVVVAIVNAIVDAMEIEVDRRRRRAAVDEETLVVVAGAVVVGEMTEAANSIKVVVEVVVEVTGSWMDEEVAVVEDATSFETMIKEARTTEVLDWINATVVVVERNEAVVAVVHAERRNVVRVRIRRLLSIVKVVAMTMRVTTRTWNEVAVESNSASDRQTLTADVDAAANTSRRGEVAAAAVEEAALPWVVEAADGVAKVVETFISTRTTSACAWMKGTREAIPVAIWIKAAVDTITTMKSKAMATMKGTDMMATIKDMGMVATIRGTTTIIRLEVAGAEAFAADEAFEVGVEDVELRAWKMRPWARKKTRTEQHRRNPTLWQPPRRQ
jgi:hypothetical protein